MKRSLLLLIFVCWFQTSYSIERFPVHYGYAQRMHALRDLGEQWSTNSTIQPPVLPKGERIQSEIPWLANYLERYRTLAHEITTDSTKTPHLILYPAIGGVSQFGAARKFDGGAGVVHVRSYYWHNGLYFKLGYVSASQAQAVKGFAGVQRKHERAGLSTAEVDESGIGYMNEWMTVEYGRNRENWGTNPESNILLSGTSPAYERLLLDLRYKGFRYRWFFGYLESVFDDSTKKNIQRYLVAKSIEWSNQKNLVLSIGETSLLAGPDRIPDPAFLNPVSEHVEIEQNDRDSEGSGNHSNSVFFGSMDWMPHSTLRISGTLIADEYPLDPSDKHPKDGAIGGTGRIAWTPLVRPIVVTLLANGYRMGTYALQHQYKYCNQMTKSTLLGDPRGNDADDYSIGARAIFQFPLMVEALYGRERWGSNNMSLHPYVGYVDLYRLPFPSGDVRTNHYLAFTLDAAPHKYLNVNVEGRVDLSHSGPESARELYTISLQTPILYYLKL